MRAGVTDRPTSVESNEEDEAEGEEKGIGVAEKAEEEARKPPGVVVRLGLRADKEALGGGGDEGEDGDDATN